MNQTLSPTLVKKFCYRPAVALVLVFSVLQTSRAQGIKKITAVLDSISMAAPSEKIFIHTDKPYYTSTDTIWFKAYLLSGTTNAFSKRSGLIYVELISDSLQVIQRMTIPAVNGISWGQIPLNEDLFPEGFYTLRAYTNWMQNFGPETFFTKNLYVANVGAKRWLVSEQHSLSGQSFPKKLSFAFQLRNQENRPLNFTEINWRVLDGKKTLLKQRTSSLDGRVEGSIEINEGQKGPLSILAEGTASEKAIIPLKINDPENIDLQFMVEGGRLVAELPAKIAFKAISADGLGIDVEGSVTDSKNAEVCTFKSVHNGMGAFQLNPAAGETYTATIKLPGGGSKTFPLPEVRNSGTSIRILNTPKSDSIRIMIFISKDLMDGRTYTIAGSCRGISYYQASFIANRQSAAAMVAKEVFPSGVAHFTLFDDRSRPLNERITFVDHHDRLNIAASSPKDTYRLRDSVPLSFIIRNTEGHPVTGSFSVAVTDDNCVNTDSLEENLQSLALLSSELKGHIEKPGYYLSGRLEAASALELLMLTQGWRGYNWEKLLKPIEKPAFIAEPQLRVSGKVTNVFNRPVEKSRILLLSSGKYRFLRDTVTNSSGRFEFADFPPLDTVSFFVQARNARGKSFNIGLEIDKFQPATVAPVSNSFSAPWYVNTDSTLLNYVLNAYREQREKERDMLKGGNLLKQVVVTGKKAIKTSKNLNGPGEADQIIDELQIRKAAARSLLFLLMNQLKGLYVRTKGTEQFYAIQDKKVRFVIDGIDINRFFNPSDPPLNNEYYDYVNNTLDAIDVNEVVGVELMLNPRYANRYNTEFLNSQELLNGNFAFVEISTRSGKGLFMKPTPGIAVYRPLPVSWPREFYRPKYIAANEGARSPDLRSTIHWEPNLVSDNTGRAFLSFYTADKPGTYSVIIQGTDLRGSFGCKTFRITVER